MVFIVPQDQALAHKVLAVVELLPLHGALHHLIFLHRLLQIGFFLHRCLGHQRLHAYCFFVFPSLLGLHDFLIEQDLCPENTQKELLVVPLHGLADHLGVPVLLAAGLGHDELLQQTGFAGHPALLVNPDHFHVRRQHPCAVGVLGVADDFKFF